MRNRNTSGSPGTCFCIQRRLPYRSVRLRYTARSFVTKAAALTSIAILANQATGQDRWLPASGGSFENAANWSTGDVPGGLDLALFNLSTATPYLVTVGADHNIGGLNVLNNSVTLGESPGEALLTFGNINVNASAGQTCSFTLNGSAPYGTDGGGFTALNNPQTNALPGSVGGPGATYFTLNNTAFENEGSPFNFSTGSHVQFNNSEVNGSVGFLGSAIYNASIGSSGFAVAGNGSVATVDVKNGSTIDDGILIGELGYPFLYGPGVVNVDDSKASGNYFLIGALGGVGTLNLTHGSQVNGGVIAVGGEFYVNYATGMGTLTVTGAGSAVAATTVVEIANSSGLNLSSGGTVTTPAFNLSTGSILNIALDAPDAIAVTGLAKLAGTLDVTLGTAADPTLGNSYDLFTFGTETGTFSSINLPPLDPGLSWNTGQLYTTGIISVTTAVPEPAALAGVLALATLLLRRRRGLPSAGETVCVSHSTEYER